MTQPMRLRLIRTASVLLSMLLLPGQALTGESEQSVTTALEQIAAGDHRSEKNRARDKARHPVETLAWLGISDNMTVVELSPGGGGWYTEILAPFLRDRGKLYAAGYNPDSGREYFRRNARRYTDKLAANPALYDRVIVTVLEAPEKLAIAPDSSADMVVTFRNLHNWMGNGTAELVLSAAYSVLKPGGILGLVQHRGNPAVSQDPAARSGYVDQDFTIELAEAAGFEFVASTEINANPADTKDHPEGVWTLPPTFRLEKVDRDKYQAIGESDRMTLKFVKPAAP